MNDIKDALKGLQQTSLLDWAAQYPRSSIVELAKQLSGRVAPVTLQRELVKEARERDVFPALARSLMVRLLNRPFPHGVGRAGAEIAAAELASAFSMWVTIFDPDQRVLAASLWDGLVAQLHAHAEWVPQHGEEPRLIALFRGADLKRTARADLVNRAQAQVAAIVSEVRTNRGWLEALGQLPPGFGYLHAVSWVDAEVNNGGFMQLYKNSGGVEVPLAITALTVMRRSDLVALLRESLAFARGVNRQLLAPALHQEPSTADVLTPRTWKQLDQAWSTTPKDLFNLFALLLEEEPLLFAPPFHELQHLEDGRKWRVRTSGAGIEIEIALSDGTVITRKRACATASQAEQETAALIAEQVADGFTTLRA